MKHTKVQTIKINKVSKNVHCLPFVYLRSKFSATGALPLSGINLEIGTSVPTQHRLVPLVY